MNQLVDKNGRDASKFLNSTADRLKSLLGDRKSEFEWLPSNGTVERLWQTLKAELDLLDNEQLPVDGNEENAHPNNNIIVENNLANEEHIVKKSKTHQDKSAGSKRRSTVDERCERLAKQIVGMIGRNARTLLNPACNIEHFLRTRLGG